MLILLFCFVHKIYFLLFTPFTLFIFTYSVSKSEEKAAAKRSKDRSRSKSPFRRVRWMRGSSKSSGAASDDEGAATSRVAAALQGIHC